MPTVKLTAFVHGLEPKGISGQTRKVTDAEARQILEMGAGVLVDEPPRRATKKATAEKRKTEPADDPASES